MTIGEYFGKTKGTFPEVGAVGVESGWMNAGTLDVPNGKLWAGDPWVVDQQSGWAMTLPKGVYRVQVKGMDFKGHRRTARVRAFLKRVTKPTLGESCGQTGTDSAWVALFDLGAYRKAVTTKRAKDYEEDLENITKDEGIGVLGMQYGSNRFDMALQPSGLGDGTFTVYPLLDKGKPVGMEVEFLPPRFALEKPIPGAGGGGSDGKSKPKVDKARRAREKEFLRACEKGKFDVVKRLLKEDRDLINARGELGMSSSNSPLLLAAIFGHKDIAEALIKASHPVDVVEDSGQTPLMWACRRSYVDVVRLLLEHGADVNAKDEYKATPLHFAACPGIGNADIVRLLIDAGADHKAKDDDGRTALSEAKSSDGFGLRDDPKFSEKQADLKRVIEFLTAHAKKR
jgi:hypothetical protein